MKRILLYLAVAIVVCSAAEALGQTSRSLRRAQVEEAVEAPSTPKESDFERVVLPKSLEGAIDADTYVLGPSDEILVLVRGPQTKLHYLPVLPEGNVVLPNIGSVRASGITLSEFRATVRDRLSRYYRNVTIDVHLSRARMFVAFVVGQVQRPGPVELAAPFRVSAAVEGAGGIAGTGTRRSIEIRKDGEVVRTVDLFAFYGTGDFSHNPTLQEEQTVFVPPVGKQVSVIGEVKLPGQYEVTGSETVADVIQFCGGFTTEALTNAIVLERNVTGAERTFDTFPASQAREKRLEDLDVIVVRDRVTVEFADPVTVVGGGGRVGDIRISTEEPLRNFLTRLWRTQPAFEGDRAVLERRAEEGGVQYIRFNVREVLDGGEDGNIIVRPGDGISIPEREKTIYVTGEVTQPGAMPFRAEFNAERYIALAGGPTTAGSFDRLTIYSIKGEKRKADRDSAVYRGETIVVKRNRTKVFGSVFVGLTSLSSLVISVIALTR